MIDPLFSLIGFVLWGLFLVICVGSWRAGLVLAGKAPPNGFPSGTRHGTDLYWRLNRAHVNTMENLPVFAALVLACEFVGLDPGRAGPMALTVLVARVCQSLFHVSSGRSLAVNFRFTAYLAQLAMFIGYAVMLIGKLQAA